MRWNYNFSYLGHFLKRAKQKKLRMYFVLLFLSLLATWINPLWWWKSSGLVLRTKVTAYGPLCLQVEERMSDVKAEQESSPGCAEFSSKVSWCRYQIISLSKYLPTFVCTGLTDSTSRWLSIENQKTRRPRGWNLLEEAKEVQCLMGISYRMGQKLVEQDQWPLAYLSHPESRSWWRKSLHSKHK